jgi:hypothetical protein
VRFERRRTPRRSNELVRELIEQRDILREKVCVANDRLAALDSGQVRDIRAILSSAEVDLHMMGAKSLEWAQAVQAEMTALRRF